MMRHSPKLTQVVFHDAVDGRCLYLSPRLSSALQDNLRAQLQAPMRRAGELPAPGLAHAPVAEVQP